jgi:hypothetical protein
MTAIMVNNVLITSGDELGYQINAVDLNNSACFFVNFLEQSFIDYNYDEIQEYLKNI